jgi:uncharacterized membrane protein
MRHALARVETDAVLGVLALAVIVGLGLAWPGGLLDKADHAAYAVCHRIAARSFIVGGRPLPLCARCSGTYLGALAGLIVLALRGRGRATAFPARRYLAMLAVFFAAWAADGLNSYLTLFPVLPHLYEPHNWLRLVTGTLEGLGIAVLLLPALNLTLWAQPVAVGGDHATPSICRWGDVAWLLVGGAAVVAVVASEWAPLLYPLALLSGLMIVFLVGVVNSIAVLALLHRDGRAFHWREVAAPLLVGAALAFVELSAIGLMRAELTARLGLPF